jgi:hypothetical protein
VKTPQKCFLKCVGQKRWRWSFFLGGCFTWFFTQNRMIFEVQIVIVKMIIFNSTAKQEEVWCLQGIFQSSIT